MIQCEICGTKKPAPDTKKSKMNPAIPDEPDNKNNNIPDPTNSKNTNNTNNNNKCKQTFPSSFNKWYWKHDDGDFKPLDDEISKQLNELTIGDIKTITIDHSKYYFKKLENDKCSQENIKTNKIRAVRMAKYKWFKQSKNGLAEPIAIADDLCKILDECKISNSVRCSKCILMTKNTENKATEKNIVTNSEINIIRKMILNDNNNIVKGHGLNKNEVAALFFKSLSKTDYKIVDIQDVSKKENMSIYENILASKCQNNNINRKRSRGSMEKYLWHGSRDINNLQSILKNGFDRSYNKAAMYGKGTYFAKQAAYSVKKNFCGRDNENIFYIFLCKVIVGEYTVGDKSMEKIPTKQDGMEYESLVDNMHHPQIFVSWRDYHALPYYLIKFKKLRIQHRQLQVQFRFPSNNQRNQWIPSAYTVNFTHHNNNRFQPFQAPIQPPTTITYVNQNRAAHSLPIPIPIPPTANNQNKNNNFNINRNRSQPLPPLRKPTNKNKKQSRYRSPIMMKRYLKDLKKYNINNTQSLPQLQPTTIFHLPQPQLPRPLGHQYPQSLTNRLVQSIPTNSKNKNKNMQQVTNQNSNQQQIHKRNQEEKDYEYAMHLQTMFTQQQNTNAQNTVNTQIPTTMNSNSSKENQEKVQKRKQSATLNQRKRNRATLDTGTTDNTVQTYPPHKKPKLCNNDNVVIDLTSPKKK